MASAPVELAAEMNAANVKPSTRLVRAADAERDEIERQRARLSELRTRLADELAGIEASLAMLAERESLLGQLIGPSADSRTEPRPAEREGLDVQAVDDEPAGHRRVLRGPEIREAAVDVLAGRPQAGAVHYRAWYKMLVDTGYEVMGKDPVAVFLTQISRSPVVRRSTQAGVYALDHEAPNRLRREVAGLESQLRGVTSGGSADLTEIRNRRERLLSELRRAERGLAEAERVLGPTRSAERHVATA